MTLVEKKEWDSALFGFAVGQVELGTNQQFSESALANAQEFELIYLFSPTPISSSASIFRDCKVELSHTFHTAGVPQQTTSIKPYSGEAVWLELLSLALQSGQYSRFKLDERFAMEHFNQLYETWLSRSISKAIADEVLLAWSNEGKLLGLITLAGKKNYCDIGLLAVDESARGKGIGKSLIDAAREFALHRGLSELRVATQECNQSAVQFYESCGFTIFKRTYIGHYWTNKS